MIRTSLIAVIVVLFSGACNSDRKGGVKDAGTEGDSLIEAHLHTYIDTIWNRKDTTYLKFIISQDIKRTLNGIAVADSKREMQAHLSVFFTAFPDLKLTLEQSYIRGGIAFLLWRTEGTNTGIFGEVGPTGKKVKINGMSELYFDKDGKLYREIVYYNELDLLQQLGYSLIPPVLQ